MPSIFPEPKSAFESVCIARSDGDSLKLTSILPISRRCLLEQEEQDTRVGNSTDILWHLDPDDIVH